MSEPARAYRFQWLYTLAGKIEWAEEQDGHAKWLDERNWPAELQTLADELCAPVSVPEATPAEPGDCGHRQCGWHCEHPAPAVSSPAERDAWYEQRNAESGGNVQPMRDPYSSSRPVVSSPGADRPDGLADWLMLPQEPYGAVYIANRRIAEALQERFLALPIEQRAAMAGLPVRVIDIPLDELADQIEAEVRRASVRSGEQQ